MYNNYTGIDIGKQTFFVSINQSKHVKEYINDSSGIKLFLCENKSSLLEGLCILESTGGHELNLLLSICKSGYKVHKANTRKVKHFIRSYGNEAKTDRLDSIALSRYGKERASSLSAFKMPSKNALKLFDLAQRRLDLKTMIVAEKNRIQGPRASTIKKSCSTVLKVLTKEVDAVSKEIDSMINDSEDLAQKKEILKTIPGVGDITANNLIILLPELGSLSRQQIASLAGVAPCANDSGKYHGYRSTRHGRNGIKPILFMSAMAAIKSHSSLAAFYSKLIANGKKKMVALVAVMRKIIVIANARLKEHLQQLETITKVSSSCSKEC